MKTFVYVCMICCMHVNMTCSLYFDISIHASFRYPIDASFRTRTHVHTHTPVEPGDVMLREVVKYGEALTTQDKPSLRSTDTAEGGGGGLITQDKSSLKSINTAEGGEAGRKGGGEAGRDGEDRGRDSRGVEGGQGPNVGQGLGVVGRQGRVRETLVTETSSASSFSFLSSSTATSSASSNMVGDTSASKVLSNNFAAAVTSFSDKKEGGSRQEEGTGDRREEGGGERQGRRLLQSSQPSISAVFRIVCKNITMAMVMEKKVIEVISVGSLDEKMEALGYKNIKASVLGPPIVTIPPACGDGSRHELEACDDHNIINGDGCSSKCAVEMGWVCLGGGKMNSDVCTTLCGNGVPTLGEECDDGNVLSGDGCDSACRVQKGWLCTQVDKVGMSVCRKFVETPAFDPPAGPVNVLGPVYAVGTNGIMAATVSIEDYYLIRTLFINISLVAIPPQAKILYTIDGSDPLKGGLTFGAPLQIKGGSTRVRAVAISDVNWPFWMAAAQQEVMPVVSAEAVGDYTVSVCQDGIRTREEECDDGVGGGQGCSMECTTEIGWVCDDTAAQPRSHNFQAEIKSKCRDCKAAAAIAAIEAASQGRAPPPLSTLNCPSGFYMGEVCGTCAICPKGFSCKGGPKNERFPCGTGTYAEQIGQFSCNQCPANAVSSRAAKSITECECAPGFTGLANSDIGCQFCADAFKPLRGPQACTPCPPNAKTLKPGRTNVLECQCVPGYHNRHVTEWWAALPKTNDDGTPFVPKKNDDGTLFGWTPTAIDCMLCKGGYYCKGGNLPQTQCVINFWSPPGSARCNACPIYTAASVTSPISSTMECACDSGFYSINADQAPPCAPCPAGFYNDYIGNGDVYTCLACPPGTFSTSPNASKAAECKSCTVLGGGRALTSPRGSSGGDACISGAWLAVANMAAAKGRPTRVYTWKHQGDGGFDVALRTPPSLPPIFDSDELGRLPDVTGVRWIQQQDWDTAFHLQPSPRSPSALLLASSYTALYLLEMIWPASGEPMHFSLAQQISKVQIGQVVEVVTFHNGNPVLVLTTQVDNTATPGGVIYTLEPPSQARPAQLKPLKGSGELFRGPTKHTSDMHAFRPTAVGGIWYLAVANQRLQQGQTVTPDAVSFIFKWMPPGPGSGCVAPDWDCGSLVEVQRLSVPGASDFESFQIGETHYLALSSALDSLNSQEPLRVYKVDKGGESTGALLVLHQTIQALEARWITPFAIHSHVYLAVAQWRGVAPKAHETNSPIYRWDQSALPNCTLPNCTRGQGAFVLWQVSRRCSKECTV